MELWDVLTADRERTGRTVVRGQALGAGEYHVVVHVWLINDEGERHAQCQACVHVETGRLFLRCVGYRAERRPGSLQDAGRGGQCREMGFT